MAKDCTNSEYVRSSGFVPSIVVRRILGIERLARMAEYTTSGGCELTFAHLQQLLTVEDAWLPLALCEATPIELAGSLTRTSR